jgi:hypothetical protein
MSPPEVGEMIGSIVRIVQVILAMKILCVVVQRPLGAQDRHVLVRFLVGALGWKTYAKTRHWICTLESSNTESRRGIVSGRTGMSVSTVARTWLLWPGVMSVRDWEDRTYVLNHLCLALDWRPNNSKMWQVIRDLQVKLGWCFAGD